MRETYELQVEPVNTQARPNHYKVTWVEDGDGPVEEKVAYVPMEEVHDWVERERPEWLESTYVWPDHRGEPVEIQTEISPQEFVDGEMTDADWIEYLKTRGIDIAPLNSAT